MLHHLIEYTPAKRAEGRAAALAWLKANPDQLEPTHAALKACAADLAAAKTYHRAFNKARAHKFSFDLFMAAVHEGRSVCCQAKRDLEPA